MVTSFFQRLSVLGFCALLALAGLVSSQAPNLQCQITKNVPRLIAPPRNGVRMTWRTQARPTDPNVKGPYRAYYAISTPFNGITVNAYIDIAKVTPTKQQPLLYAVNYHVTLMPHTGQTVTQWPHLKFYFINHPNGDSNVVYTKGINECCQIAYTDNPNMLISDVYAFPFVNVT